MLKIIGCDFGVIKADSHIWWGGGLGSHAQKKNIGFVMLHSEAYSGYK